MFFSVAAGYLFTAAEKLKGAEKVRRSILLLLVVCFTILATSQTARAATQADVLVLVDESGSMGGEHAWLPGMI